jgi:hypothetical protein
MAEHDWTALYGALSDATGEWSREELIALLLDLIREYVVEGDLPTSTTRATIPDLTQMDFGQLITWLKRNLSVPELSLFQVEGSRVIVDAEGPRALTLDNAKSTPPTPTSSWPPAVTTDVDATTDAYPAAEPASTNQAEDDADGDDRSGAKRKLSPGFHGLEFD